MNKDLIITIFFPLSYILFCGITITIWYFIFRKKPTQKDIIPKIIVYLSWFLIEGLIFCWGFSSAYYESLRAGYHSSMGLSALAMMLVFGGLQFTAIVCGIEYAIAVKINKRYLLKHIILGGMLFILTVLVSVSCIDPLVKYLLHM